MNQMWKYELKINELNTIEVPCECIVRAVQMQGDTIPCIWVEVETKNRRHQKTFKFFPTGADIDQPALYVGTVQLGWTVWHLYEVFERTLEIDFKGKV